MPSQTHEKIFEKTFSGAEFGGHACPRLVRVRVHVRDFPKFSGPCILLGQHIFRDRIFYHIICLGQVFERMGYWMYQNGLCPRPCPRLLKIQCPCPRPCPRSLKFSLSVSASVSADSSGQACPRTRLSVSTDLCLTTLKNISKRLVFLALIEFAEFISHSKNGRNIRGFGRG